MVQIRVFSRIHGGQQMPQPVLPRDALQGPPRWLAPAPPLCWAALQERVQHHHVAHFAGAQVVRAADAGVGVICMVNDNSAPAILKMMNHGAVVDD